jgi:cytochrome c oxidase assembly protein subunit 15
MKSLNSFQKLALATVLATIFLIFIGGLVRATGAGLGCPDWPKCFGLWIPPISADTLPDSFDATNFNVLKTWTEYINRLIGVVIGLLITATFISSLKYRKTKPSVTYSAVFSFIAVVFQGWLGGQVVRTGLSEGLITIHMLIAMLILLALLFSFVQSLDNKQFKFSITDKQRKTLNILSFALLASTLVQIVLGTQVREAIDLVSEHLSIGNGALWLDEIGNIDEIHRTTSWSLVLIAAAISWLTFKSYALNSISFKKVVLIVDSLILIQILFGIILYYGGVPRSFQVLHLAFSALLMCALSVQSVMIFKARD